MKRFVYLILLPVFAACGGKKEDTSTAPPVSMVENKPAVEGSKVFKISCAVCHGPDGKLGLNGSKDLSVSVLTLEERIALITKGKGAMPAQENILSAEEIKAAAEYSMTLKK
ncbi:MAG TPA: cytochrome c [Saprospiraceae bacterium]|nr:cytochrome c [Saprospiraceae bacterium]